MKCKYLSLLLAAAIPLSGCSSSSVEVISGADAPYAVPATSAAADTAVNPKIGEYSAEDIRRSAENSPMHSETLSKKTDDDLSDDAVIIYNNLMIYADSHLGGQNFSIFDYGAVRSDDGAVSGYVLKIVLREFADSGDTEHAPIMFSCNADGGRIKSNLAGFVYSRKWTETLRDEINDRYPLYHMNTYSLPPDTELLSIDRGEETYNTMNIGIEPMEGEWSVNLILPPDTSKEEFAKAYDELSPVLKRFSVDSLTVLAADSKESYDKFISDENITGNSYLNCDNGFEWREIINDLSASDFH